MEFGHYVSVHIGDPHPVSSRLEQLFHNQMETLEQIEEDDRMDSGLEAQVISPNIYLS